MTDYGIVILNKIIDRINLYIKAEQNALKDDDPDSTCAAHHRGSISAYGSILKYIIILLSENK